MTETIRRMIQEIIGGKPEATVEYVTEQVHERLKRTGMRDGLRDEIGKQNVNDMIRTMMR